jgi:hypothetical protein
LEDEHPVAWPEVDRMEFMAKVRLLTKLMKNTPETPGQSPYYGTLDADREVHNGLRELNSLRNRFIHYKAERVAIGSPEDPYEKLNKSPSIIKKLGRLCVYGLSIPKV